MTEPIGKYDTGKYETLGKYEIIRRIGSGGFGAVYQARDAFLKRSVAIKTCQIDDEEVRARFFREAELAGSLHHRNITTIFDSGIERGMPFLVQEFLSGEDLDRLIARAEPLSVARKLEILIGVAYGLEHAHAEGIIHRDIKPANVRVLDDGTVKIMDFGIAKSLRADRNLTDTGATLGTSAYLAPEQIRGLKADRRTDVFAFGVLAYELLTGRKPFHGDSLPVLFDEILKGSPVPIPDLAPEVPRSLVALVQRTMRIMPEERSRSFTDVREDLLGIQRDLKAAAERAGEAFPPEAPGERSPWLAPVASFPASLPSSAQTAEVLQFPAPFPTPAASTGSIGTATLRRESRRTVRAASIAALVFLGLSGALVLLWPSRPARVAREDPAPRDLPAAAPTEVVRPAGESPFVVADAAPPEAADSTEPDENPDARRAARSERASGGADDAGAPRISVQPSRPGRALRALEAEPLPSDRYTRAASAPGLSDETRAHILLQSALAQHAAGEDERAQASLRAAFSLSPDLPVAADVYGARFARLANGVRGGGGD